MKYGKSNWCSIKGLEIETIKQYARSAQKTWEIFKKKKIQYASCGKNTLETSTQQRKPRLGKIVPWLKRKMSGPVELVW